MIHDDGYYHVPAHNWEMLQAKIGEMNRRAARLGCEPITLRIVDEYEVERKRERSKIKCKVRYFRVEATGQTPKLKGWRLMAAVEKQETGENILRCVPGVTLPESFRTTDAHCDHCKSDRRRKEVFILQHDDGRYAQVGRQCIADFLGRQSVEHICGMAEWDFNLSKELDEAGDEDYCGHRGETVVNMTEYVTAAAICVRRLGWISRSKAAEWGGDEGGPQASSDSAWDICTRHDHIVAEWIVKNELYPEERDEKLAAEAIAWARALPTQGVPEYIYNLGVACRMECVRLKTRGLVASVISAYLREQDRIAELGYEAKKERKHVGTVGERTGFAQVTVVRLKYFEGNFGVKTLCKFETAEGNWLVWWASGNTDWLNEGDVVDITATIKKHSEYKDKPQTELSRVAQGLPKPKKAKKPKVAV